MKCCAFYSTYTYIYALLQQGSGMRACPILLIHIWPNIEYLFLSVLFYYASSFYPLYHSPEFILFETWKTFTLLLYTLLFLFGTKLTFLCNLSQKPLINLSEIKKMTDYSFWTYRNIITGFALHCDTRLYIAQERKNTPMKIYKKSVNSS